MNWVTSLFSSSLGRKLIMSLTGLFLCSFLVVHMSGNLQLFKQDQGLAFNTYAVFMTTFPPIKFISYGLYAMILVHAIDGLMLAFKNRSARPQRYAVVHNQSSWASRNMPLLGTLLLVYLVVHMGDFWAEYKFGHIPYRQYHENLSTGQISSRSYFFKNEEPEDLARRDAATFMVGPAITGKMQELTEEVNGQRVRSVVVKDLYSEVAEAFKHWWLVLIYLIGMAALSFHLLHGFQSAFQTLGWNHSKYNPIIRFIGTWVFAVGIPLAFAAMPVYFFIRSLAGNPPA